MPQRVVFHLPSALDPVKRGTFGHDLFIHLIIEVIIIVAFYYMFKEPPRQLPYNNLVEKTYAKNRLTLFLQDVFQESNNRAGVI